MSSTTRNRALAAFLAVTTGALLLVTSPAQAATASKKDASDSVCWLNADTDEFQCFEDEAAFEDAVFEQTGTVLVEGDSGLASRGDTSILASFVLARFYEFASYGGSSVAVTSGSSATCTTGSGKSADMPSGWNDRVSSFHSYLSCSTRIFEDVGLGGAWFGYSIDAPGVGALDNEASSYRVQ